MSGDAPSIQSKIQVRRRNWLFVWSVGGVLLLLIQAQIRLGQIAWQAVSSGEMNTFQYGLCAAWVALNGYMEGYRGFQKRFVPRVLARAHYLSISPPKTSFAVFAPFFAMAYFHAAKKAKYAAWGVTCAVLIAIFVVRSLPQPWRGLIDAGVVAGLLWGSSCLLIGVIRRLLGWDPEGVPDLPPSKVTAPG